MFVCSPQDLSSLAMPFLEGDAEHANKDGVCKVTQPKHTQRHTSASSKTVLFLIKNNFCSDSLPKNMKLCHLLTLMSFKKHRTFIHLQDTS